MSAIRTVWGQPPRRIVVVRPGRLGDTLLAVPALRALRYSFPGAEITLIAQPWAQEMASRVGYSDRFLEFPGFPGMPEASVDARQTARFLQESTAYGYDLALHFQGWEAPAAVFTRLLGAKVTAGYCSHPEVARHLDVCPPLLDGEHEVHRLLRLVQAVGARPHGTHLEFPLLAGDFDEVAALPELAGLLDSGQTIVGLHPGAGAPAKRWPAERFARLADRLMEELDCRILLLGSAYDSEVVAEVVARMRRPSTVLCGKLGLGGLAALLSRLDLYIGNDSGPSHLAVAVGAPSITIFGPADLRRWAPLDTERHRVVYRGVECSPCGFAVCPIDHRCLELVSVEDVLGEAEALLRRRRRRAARQGTASA